MATDNLRVTSTDPSGATVATDHIDGAHYQYVKLAIGDAGDAAAVSSAVPISVVYTTAGSKPFVPVAGNTAGTTGVTCEIKGGTIDTISNIVSGTIDNVTTVASVTAVSTISNIVGGTIDNITNTVTVDGNVGILAGTATIGDIGGGTIDNVTTVASVTAVGGTVTVDGDVDVLSVTIPSSITGGNITTTTGALALSHTFTSGIRLTNTDTSYTAYVGTAGVSSDGGYPLRPLDTIFLETSSGASVFVCSGTTSCDLRYIGS